MFFSPRKGDITPIKVKLAWQFMVGVELVIMPFVQRLKAMFTQSLLYIHVCEFFFEIYKITHSHHCNIVVCGLKCNADTTLHLRIINNVKIM